MPYFVEPDEVFRYPGSEIGAWRQEKRMSLLSEHPRTAYGAATQEDMRHLVTAQQHVACRLSEVGWPEATHWPLRRRQTMRNRSADCLVYRINDIFEWWLGENGELYRRYTTPWRQSVFVPWREGTTTWPSAQLVDEIIADLDAIERKHCTSH